VGRAPAFFGALGGEGLVCLKLVTQRSVFCLPVCLFLTALGCSGQDSDSYSDGESHHPAEVFGGMGMSFGSPSSVFLRIPAP